MSTLSGQTIQSTYQGLLKLNNSTSGITNSLQSITDGLGNDTGSKISENLFTSPNQFAFYQNQIKAQYYGNGLTTTQAPVLPATSNTSLLFSYFLDFGVASYSAITYGFGTNTSSSDVFELSFYDLQWVDDYGWFPGNLIQSGITLNATSTGFQTLTLPSTLSFSGRGGGYYCSVLKITTAGTPTARYYQPLATISNQSLLWLLGLTRNNAGNAFVWGNRANSWSGNIVYRMTTNTLKQSFTPTDVINFFSTDFFSGSLGFILHTIR